MPIMSTIFHKTLVWKHEYDVKLWRHRKSPHQIQMTTICHWMKPPHGNFLRTPLFTKSLFCLCRLLSPYGITEGGCWIRWRIRDVFLTALFHFLWQHSFSAFQLLVSALRTSWSFFPDRWQQSERVDAAVHFCGEDAPPGIVRL